MSNTTCCNYISRIQWKTMRASATLLRTSTHLMTASKATTWQHLTKPLITQSISAFIAGRRTIFSRVDKQIQLWWHSLWICSTQMFHSTQTYPLLSSQSMKVCLIQTFTSKNHKLTQATSMRTPSLILNWAEANQERFHSSIQFQITKEMRAHMLQRIMRKIVLQISSITRITLWKDWGWVSLSSFTEYRSDPRQVCTLSSKRHTSKIGKTIHVVIGTSLSLAKRLMAQRFYFLRRTHSSLESHQMCLSSSIKTSWWKNSVVLAKSLDRDSIPSRSTLRTTNKSTISLAKVQVTPPTRLFRNE